VSRPRSASPWSLAAVASPGMLFSVGALLIPAFLLQRDLAIRAAQILLFISLNALSGRRVRILQFIVVSAGIVGFNLVIPTGKVLFTVLGFALTEGALKSGLAKATAMSGLIALSQFSIRADLRLPGSIGGLLGGSLFYFERIMAGRKRIDRRDIIGSLDSLLLEIHGSGRGAVAARQQRVETTAAGFAVLALILLANWGALVLTVLRPHLFWGV
jgi:hypothetical protein